MTGEPRAQPVPCLTGDLPGIGGVWKQVPADFEVEEIPAYEPSGSGEHLFLWIEKEGVAADQLVRHVARVLQITPGEIGAAGMKDRHARTRQYLSVPRRCEPRLEFLSTGAIRLLRAAPHGNKLRLGHLRGNRFRLLVRDTVPDAVERAAAIADQIGRLGVPNYYGLQRFGTADENVRLGRALLSGEKAPRSLPPAQKKFLLRMALSAVQSALFNTALADRLVAGTLHQVLAGDVMQVVASGGPFVAEDLEREQPRFERREIVITGPMFGPKMKLPAGIVAEQEDRLLADQGLQRSDFTKFAQLTAGTRRPYLIWPESLSVTSEPEGMRFEFQLPAGSYATVVLEEFCKTGTTTPDERSLTDNDEGVLAE